ncbi:MAG: O-antigen ligase family protein, partial [Bacteroidota bacterium]
MALAIIGVYFLKSVLQGKLWTSKDRIDWFLYAVFAYGIAISCIRIVGGNFSLGLFMNDLFQSGLLVSTFFVFKATPFSHKQMLRMLDFFLLGISLNAGYILYRGMANNEWGRQAGFTDNPNYAAFGLVAAMIYLFLRFGHTRRIREMVAYGILAFFLLFAFMAEGSRTGLVVLVLVLGMVFWLQSTKRKILLAGLVLILGVGMTLRNIGSGATDGANVLLTRVNRSLVQGEEDVRFVIWRGMLNVFEDAGYVGMGIGQFKHRFSFYFEEVTHKTVLEMVNRGYYLSPHNDYLAIVADYGLPGLIFYLTFLWFAGWKL